MVVTSLAPVRLILARQPPTGQSQMQQTRPEPIDFDEKPKRKAGPVKEKRPDKEYRLNDDWWSTLSPQQQRKYQEDHPNGKYADEEVKDEEAGDDRPEQETVREPGDEAKDIQKFNDYNQQTQQFNKVSQPQPVKTRGPKLGEPNQKKGLGDDDGARGKGLQEREPDLKPKPKSKSEQHRPTTPGKPKTERETELQDEPDRTPTKTSRGQKGHGLVKVKRQQLEEKIEDLPEEEQDFLKEGGTAPKSKQREKLGTFLKKDAKNLAGGYARDAGSALSGLNSVRKILKGDHLEASDWKKLGKLMFNMTGWLVATGLSGGSLGAGFLAFGALKHALVPAVGYMFKKDWTHKSKHKDGKRSKIDWDVNSDKWLKNADDSEDEDDDYDDIFGHGSRSKSKSKSKPQSHPKKDKDYEEYLKWKKANPGKKARASTLLLAADSSDEDLLAMMFERLGGYVTDGDIPDSAWAASVLDHPGSGPSSE